MTKEQIYSNITMLTSQLVSNGMKPEVAAEKAEQTVQKTLEAAKRLAESLEK